MELLAPAGTVAAFEAALAAGADAVYVGAPALNARALARDFTWPELAAMAQEAGRRGVGLHLAMNSTLKEEEIPLAVETLARIEGLRPAAVIIQDLGLFRLARRYFPDLILHASTLASVHNSLAARRLGELGFSRVVLARELTIDEIAVIHGKTQVELEVFVHGAMCFSYSGLCLFSSMHGGKSSLRGHCVQPCRRRYSEAGGRSERGRRRPSPGRGGYLFSMNDLEGLGLLPRLREAGVVCLKIEGRLRSSGYVEQVTRAYRLALDHLDAAPEEFKRVLVEARALLAQAMGRSSGGGYFIDASPRGAITPERSGNMGIFLGKTRPADQGKSSTFRRLSLVLRHAVQHGDRLRFHHEASGERISFSLRDLQLKGGRAKTAEAGALVVINLPETPPGPPLGALFLVETAERRRAEGGTSLARVKPRWDAARPAAVLRDLGWNRGAATAGTGPARSRSAGIEWWLRLRSPADLGTRFPLRPVRYVVGLNEESWRVAQRLGPHLDRQRRRLIWALPPVIHEDMLPWYAERVALLGREGRQGWMLGHLSQAGLFEGQGSEVELHADYTCNLLNHQGAALFRDLGLASAQFSIESDRAGLAAFMARGPALAVGLTVYGRPPLFTSRLDAPHFRQHQTVVSPKNEEFVLERGQGLTLARSTRPLSLLPQLGELQTLGLAYFVLDLSGGPLAGELRDLLPRLPGGRGAGAALSGNYEGGLR